MRFPTPKKYPGKILLFAAGLFLLATAMALLSASRLGMTPVQSLAYVLYCRFEDFISFGTLCFLWNMLLLLLQLILLRRNFKAYDFLQIPLSLFFGSVVDAAKWVFAFVAPQSLFARIAVMLLGVLILSFGVFLMLKAEFVLNSGEAAVRAISIVTKKSFGTIKNYFDLSTVCLALICSFVLFGTWRSDIVGAATLTCSILTGLLVKLLTKLLEGTAAT